MGFDTIEINLVLHLNLFWPKFCLTQIFWFGNFFCSTIYDQIYFYPNCFDLKFFGLIIFLDSNFVNPTFLFTQIFLIQKSFHPKFIWLKKIWMNEFWVTRKFWDQNLLCLICLLLLAYMVKWLPAYQYNSQPNYQPTCSHAYLPTILAYQSLLYMYSIKALGKSDSPIVWQTVLKGKGLNS